MFADRFHSHVLKTVREVRRAVEYVVRNREKHLVRDGKGLPKSWVMDLFSSAMLSTELRRTWLLRWLKVATPLVVPAETWLLKRAM